MDGYSSDVQRILDLGESVYPVLFLFLLMFFTDTLKEEWTDWVLRKKKFHAESSHHDQLEKYWSTNLDPLHLALYTISYACFM